MKNPEQAPDGKPDEPKLGRREFLTIGAAAALNALRGNVSAPEGQEEREVEETKQWRKTESYRIREGFERRPPKTTLREKNGNVTAVLENRAMIVSKEEFPDGFRLSCEWTWTAGQEAGANQDVLTIGLRTDGKRKEQWSYELLNGIAVRIAGHGQTQDLMILRMKDGASDVIAGGKGNIVIKKGRVYPLEITVKGKEISVRMNDDSGKDITVKADDPDERKNHFIVAYNREPSSNVQQTSEVRNVRIEKEKRGLP